MFFAKSQKIKVLVVGDGCTVIPGAVLQTYAFIDECPPRLHHIFHMSACLSF